MKRFGILGLMGVMMMVAAAWGSGSTGVLFEGRAWRLGFDVERVEGDRYVVYTNGVVCGSATNFVETGSSLVNGVVLAQVAVDMPAFYRMGVMEVRQATVQVEGLVSGMSEALNVTLVRERRPGSGRVAGGK